MAITPANATTKAVEWNSSDTSIAVACKVGAITSESSKVAGCYHHGHSIGWQLGNCELGGCGYRKIPDLNVVQQLPFIACIYLLISHTTFLMVSRATVDGVPLSSQLWKGSNKAIRAPVK